MIWWNSPAPLSWPKLSGLQLFASTDSCCSLCSIWWSISQDPANRRTVGGISVPSYSPVTASQLIAHPSESLWQFNIGWLPLFAPVVELCLVALRNVHSCLHLLSGLVMLTYVKLQQKDPKHLPGCSWPQEERQFSGMTEKREHWHCITRNGSSALLFTWCTDTPVTQPTSPQCPSLPAPNWNWMCSAHLPTAWGLL